MILKNCAGIEDVSIRTKHSVVVDRFNICQAELMTEDKTPSKTV